MLTGAIFMLEIYDRVLPSRSVPTLVAIAAIALVLFAAQCFFDVVRSRILVRVAALLDERVNPRVFDAIVKYPPGGDQGDDGLEPMRDLDAVRSFLSSAGPIALFDLPWLPFYLVIIFTFHPLLGGTALAGATALAVLAVWMEDLSRDRVMAATVRANVRTGLADAAKRNSEVLRSMGMAWRWRQRYLESSSDYLGKQMQVSDIVGGIGSLSKTMRIMLQSAMLGVGAWLVIHDEASAGIIIAGSILVGRALAPVDLAIANWKNFVSARQSWRRLSRLLSGVPLEQRRLALPPPRETLKVERLTITEPGGPRLLVRNVSFEIPCGSGLGIIGPSASGKSTLARALAGVWPAAVGRVRIDGAELSQWPAEDLGVHIGYLPQEIELFRGTVAENIARLDPKPNSEAVIAAAQMAGVHQMIVNLRDGYETQILNGGAMLSAGQRQRIALARALYGDPFLVVLDEPNSNLDTEGDRALMDAVRKVHERGGIVVMISHRPSALATLDFVLVMNEGNPLAFGPRKQIMGRFFSSLMQTDLRVKALSEKRLRMAGGQKAVQLVDDADQQPESTGTPEEEVEESAA
jgi:ATP-binding cassette subfamily C protein